MNANIITEFEKLSEQIKSDIDNTTGKQQIINSYRLKSILNVISILKTISYKITSGKQLKDILGIGKNSIARIDEILKTGKLKEINNKYNNYEAIIDELTKIYGIGRKIALELYNKYNIRSIEDLKKKYNNKEIILPPIIIKGLLFHNKIKMGIPRKEIDMIHIYLLQEAFKIDRYLHITICGSYRRLKDYSNDIDLIITHKNNINLLDVFIKELQKQKFIVESFTETTVNTKYMGICRYGYNPHRRIDIRNIKYESYYFAILYFTGSKEFNKKMRKHAITLGYKLNEYGLWKNKTSIKVNSEKEIFDILEMKYIDPYDR